MTQRVLHASQFVNEIVLTTSRSSGPGGQNVNKVNTRVTLRLDVPGSRILTPEEKEILMSKLKSVLTTEGILLLSAQENRSQLQNKEAVLVKFEKTINKALAKKKLRKASKPSKSAVEKRIQHKKKHSEKKQWRQRF